jgi:RHH-type proline utilization regulon transcriptional repressor/proline dehydrogenase/delta 1-pyrroline-5-carboxylate dehydrogenase
VFCQSVTREGLLLQVAACLATGNAARIAGSGAALDGLPAAVAARIRTAGSVEPATFDAILVEGDAATVHPLLRAVAAADGPIRPVLALSPRQVAAGQVYPPDMLLAERSTSTNTAAAGGNASLMSL